MADHTTQVMVIDASPQRCYEVISDVERYPEWATDIKSVTVLERDQQGRPLLVQFRAAAFGRSTSYTLKYDYSAAPKVVSWVQVIGDLTNKLDGEYVFAEAPAGDRPGTQVTYDLLAELKLPIPGFIKRRAEGRIVHTALRELKVRAEGAMA
jgi:ribosome-associated toxin RatA of RatAB toxin-antitoxin module